MKLDEMFEGNVVQFPKNTLATQRGRERTRSSAVADMRAQSEAELALQQTLERLDAEGARQLTNLFRPHIIDKLFHETTPITFGLYHLTKDRNNELTPGEREYINNYIDSYLDEIIDAVDKDLRVISQIKRAIDNDDTIPHKKYLYRHVDEVERIIQRELEFFTKQVNLNEAMDLFEFKASPGALKSLAAGIDATVGIEFEMMYPGVESEDGELEPDYSEDSRVYSIEDMIEFYNDNDELGLNHPRDLRRLEALLDGEFADWISQRAVDEFESSGDIEELVTAVVEYENPMEQWIGAWLEDNADEDLDEDEQREAAEDAYKEFIEEEVGHAIRQRDESYDVAKDEWIDEWLSSTSLDTEDFLNEEYNVHNMSDAESNFGVLTWPIMRATGSIALEEVAESISDALGKPVELRGGYDTYVLTTDVSISPDDSEYGGIELVSAALSLNEMLDDLDTIYSWARNNSVLTNRSTGLHINVSVEGYNRDELDYTKLALLIGDEYILNKYQRLGNTYATSAVSNITRKIQQLKDVQPAELETVFRTMKGGFDKFSSDIIHAPATNKYTSINVKDNRIEFRSPGGDWLSKNPDEIKTTILRFVVALDAAMDPEKYRREYLKKLYKLMSDATTNKLEKDIITLFTDYASGKLQKQDLVNFIRQAREKKDGSERN